MEDLLSSTIENLEIWCPGIELYDWLRQILCYRDDLPKWSRVEVQCVSERLGDSYESFPLAYFPNPHPIFATLRSLSLELILKEPFYWLEEWDAYDHKTLELEAWQVSLGERVRGMIVSLAFQSYMDANMRRYYARH